MIRNARVNTIVYIFKDKVKPLAELKTAFGKGSAGGVLAVAFIRNLDSLDEIIATHVGDMSQNFCRGWFYSEHMEKPLYHIPGKSSRSSHQPIRHR
jgi:hypothetical protein